MRRVVAVGVGALAGVLASCVPPRSGPTPTLAQEPSSAWTVVARHPSRLSTLARTRPELADLVLYLEAREAARSGDDATALDRIAALQERVPDSIWLPSARLLAGQLRRKEGDDVGARAWLV